jgi:hypothetical protein
MTALVLGDGNNPNPTPTKISLQTISVADDAAVNCEKKYNPIVTVSIPNELSSLDPTLSESQPLSGERRAIAAV